MSDHFTSLCILNNPNEHFTHQLLNVETKFLMKLKVLHI
jgi:hypothetical protein